jgi:ABC-type phosphate transport system ATPase subunit
MCCEHLRLKNRDSDCKSYTLVNKHGIEFDPEQIRIINWRMTAKDIAAVIGPPGCGKTTVGGALAY